MYPRRLASDTSLSISAVSAIDLGSRGEDLKSAAEDKGGEGSQGSGQQFSANSRAVS